MLPALAEWIAHLSRMSGKSVTARTSMTPQAWFIGSPASSRPIAVADAAAGAVGADDVLGPDRRGLPGLLALLQVRHGDGHRVLRSAAGVDPDVGGVQAVERRQPAGRALHVVEEVGQHPRLVDDHVRHLREALFDVLDASGARDPGPVLRVRPPERDLVDPVALVDQPVREAERLEHLHVRQATPSACPTSSGPSFRSMTAVRMSGKLASCAASTSPAGPHPTIRTSTSSGRTSGPSRRTGPGPRRTGHRACNR